MAKAFRSNSQKQDAAASSPVWSQAQTAAARGHHGYAAQLVYPLVLRHPEWLEARRFVREQTIALRVRPNATGWRNRMQASWLRLRAAFLRLQARMLMGRNPAQALERLEAALLLVPHDARTNLLLAQTAQRLGLWEVAALAYETIRAGRPSNKQNLLLLAETYMQLQYGPDAVKVYEQVLGLDAHDGQALSGLKDAAALASNQLNGWSEAEDFRALIRN